MFVALKSQKKTFGNINTTHMYLKNKIFNKNTNNLKE